ncbi:MAG: hypothetical protein ACE5KX_04105, partial [Acidimicrobiia bacterium]
MAGWVLSAAGAILLLSLVIGGAVLVLRSKDDTVAPTAEFTTGYGPGVILLEPADEVGPDPFLPSAAVAPALDPATRVLPPRDPAAWTSPHGRNSQADRLAAGAVGWELTRLRDQGGNPLDVTVVRDVVRRTLGTAGTAADLDDLDG